MAGTVNFWIDLGKNAGAFTHGKNFHWGEFPIDDQRFQVASEGKNLVVRELIGDRNVIVFNKEINLSDAKRHMVTLTVDTEVILYWDSERV